MTAKKRALGSDLKKVDRHVIRPHEYDEVPELTDEMFERADLYHGGKLIRRQAAERPCSIPAMPRSSSRSGQ
jgi:hypothetical protein